MADFGSSAAYDEAPPFLSNYSRYGAILTANVIVGPVAAATTTWNTADQARYYPLTLPFAYPVRRMWWINGSTADGNRDIAIYTASGARLVSAGSTGASGASGIQFVDVTDTYLAPGDYYLGFNCSLSTANRVWGHATAVEVQRAAGIMQQAVGATALPASATFAAATVIGVNMCGITWTASGF